MSRWAKETALENPNSAAALLPKNKSPFSAEKRSFEQNGTHPDAYSARKITASLQQTLDNEFVLIFGPVLTSRLRHWQVGA
jgi:hypothetical protein